MIFDKFCILIFYYWFQTNYMVRGDEHERKLYDMLLLNYNTLERPVENNSLPVIVYLGLYLQQIIDLVK